MKNTKAKFRFTSLDISALTNELNERVKGMR